MYYYRWMPSDSHLNAFESEIHQRFLDGRCEQIECTHPTLEAFKFYDYDVKDWNYFLIDTELALATKPRKSSRKPNPAVHGFCSLERIKRWVSYEITMVYVNPEQRGKGLGPLLYDCVLRDGKIIVSGFSQRPPSKKIWIRLAQNPEYFVWAHDIMDLSRSEQIDVVNGKFVCGLKLYRDIKTIRRKKREDIRLVAVLNK